MSSRGTILIVDDELGVRESLRMILKPFYKIYTASDGKEALKYVKDKDIDLITMDLKMPGLSGIQTVREIRKINEDIGIIIITAYGNLENAKEAINYKVKDFIAKPFELSEVIHVVSQFFEIRNSILMLKTLTQKVETFLLENSYSSSPMDHKPEENN